MSGMDSSAAPAPKQQTLRLQSVKVLVRDQEKSVRFYVDQLGFQLVSDTRLQSGERWAAVAPPDGSALLLLVSPDPTSKEFLQIGRPTGVVFITEDVVAQYHAWRQNGVRFLYAPRLRRIRHGANAEVHDAASLSTISNEPVWGGVFTEFRDVDGNSFMLVRFDEVTQHMERERRALAEKIEGERRAAQELEIAKQVQAGLFPQKLPAAETLEFTG